MIAACASGGADAGNGSTTGIGSAGGAVQDSTPPPSPALSSLVVEVSYLQDLEQDDMHKSKLVSGGPVSISQSITLQCVVKTAEWRFFTLVCVFLQLHTYAYVLK